MATSAQQADPFIILYGIPWKTYERILEALGRYQLRHTYDHGTLEMRALLYGVAWEDYQRLLDALPDYPLRHTYAHGTLEMMSPRNDHDWVKRVIGRLIEFLSISFDIEIQSIGSTTLTGEAVERGFQPDEAYYIANESVVRGKRTYDPDQDPPPDLLVEVDVTSSSLDRMSGFAAIRVPEVWRHDNDQITFYQLSDAGEYTVIEQSVAFPFLKPADIDEAIELLEQVSENSALRQTIEKLQPRLDENLNR